MTGSRRSGPWRLLGVLALSLIVGLVLAEGILRLLRLAPTEGLATVTEADFERIPGIFAPRQQVVVRQIPALPYRVSIDSLGFRGTEFPRAKPPGETRILFIGDSFVHGDFVDDDQTLPVQLESVLRRTCHNVRVINAGLGGSTIVDQRELVRRGLSLSPDLVILGFSENDISDLARTTSEWEQLKKNRAMKSRFPMSLLYGPLRKTALWNLALSARGRMNAAQGADVARSAPVTAQSEAAVARLRERYRAELVGLRDSLRAQNIPIVLVAFPAHLTVSGVWRPDQIEWIVATATAAGIPAVNLLPPLQQLRLPPESLFLLPHDGHPSPRGYGVAASYLAERVTQVPPVSGVCRADRQLTARAVR